MVKLFSSLVIFLFLQPAYAITYGAYRTIAQGSARNIGMGGAFIALENDSSSVWVGPATLPISGLGIDLNLTQSQIFSAEPVPGQGDTIMRSEYNMFSVTFMTSKDSAFVIGFGYPYIEGHGNPIYSNSGLNLFETRISQGKKISENISVAPTLIYRNMTAKFFGYQDAGGNPLTEEQAQQSIDFALSGAAKFGTWMTALSWENPRTFNFYNPAQYTLNLNGLYPVKIPAVSRFGVSKSFPEYSIIVSAQLDWFMDTAGLSGFIDSRFSSNQSISTSNNLFIPRFGFEHQFVDGFWAKSWVRIGYYVENPKTNLETKRDHWTIGGEAKIWVLFLNFAYDYAPEYANAATTMGITISDYW